MTVEPPRSLIKLTYLDVRARIVVNAHGEHWRVYLQRQWKSGKTYGPFDESQPLILDSKTTAFPTRELAIIAGMMTVIELEDTKLKEERP